MKKFSEFKKFRINEQEITLNQPTIETDKEEENAETVQSTDQVTQQQPQVKVTVTSQQIEPSVEQPVDSKEEKIDQIEAVKLFSKLFESREMAHVYHLQAQGDGSFASHNALNTYYDEILDLIDIVIETYSGQYGIVENYETIDTTGTKTKEKIEYFTDLAKFIKDSRYSALSKEDTHLQSIIDDITSLVYRTIYRLNLK